MSAEIPVTEYLRRQPASLRPTLQAGRRSIKTVAPKKTKETAYRMWPLLYSLDGLNVCGMAPGSGCVRLSFFRGAELDDPDGVLEGTGKGMRHIKLREPSDADQPAVRRMIRRAFRAGGIARSGRGRRSE